MIGIIDYGLGNIDAFLNIYKRLHISVKSLKTPKDFEGIKKLILPGVGAFDHAMESFKNSGMIEIVHHKVLDEKMPIIGICVGMQMLANSSDEGKLPGLGWIGGQVKRFDDNKIPFVTRLPHMGWNDVELNTNSCIFQEFPDNPKFYFLHSYYFDCTNNEDCIARADYGGTFCCAVNKDNIYGVQFHPEKSHHFGVKLLENFSKKSC